MELVEVKCHVCGEMHTSESIRPHMDKAHYAIHKSSCIKCITCNLNYGFVDHLIKHLEFTHKMTFEVEEKTLDSRQDFDDWKTSVESNNCARFIKRQESHTKIYYSCHRTPSGHNNVRDPNVIYKRKPKRQGSCKSSQACTSYMKVGKSGGKFHVVWQKTHYGHEQQLEHLRLPDTIRQNIAQQLINGVHRKDILKSLAQNRNVDDPKREHLITGRDVDNIALSLQRSSNAAKVNKNNDFPSVDLWVQQCSFLDETPVRFFKKQGSSCEGFADSDFCLVYMSKIQVEMIKTFGCNVIAVDGTHGLTGYNFELVTLLVVDEYKNGFPVAYLFSNRNDSFIYSHFFTCVRNTVGVIRPKTFLSDIELAFYNAWKEVMEASSETLWCPWLVDRAWQSNLLKIRNLDKRNEVATMLKVLQQETPLEQFPMALSNFINHLLKDRETRRFGNFFSFYVPEAKNWAYCYSSSGMHTDLQLEGMNEIIKYFPLPRKTVRQFEEGLHAALKYLKTKTVSRFINSCDDGKMTGENRLSIERHHSARTMKGYTIERENDYHIVKCKRNRYKVQHMSTAKCCENACSYCKICIHSYVCECPDYTRNEVICKHIHFLLLLRHGQSNESESVTFYTDKVNVDLAPLQNNAKYIQDSHKQTIQRAKAGMVQLFQNLKSFNWEEADPEIIKSLDRSFTKLNTLIKNPRLPTEFTPSISQCTKKLKIDPQLRSKKTSEQLHKSSERSDVIFLADIPQDRPILFTYLNSISFDHNYI